jgi:hypothetical protein
VYEVPIAASGSAAGNGISLGVLVAGECIRSQAVAVRSSAHSSVSVTSESRGDCRRQKTVPSPSRTQCARSTN